MATPRNILRKAVAKLDAFAESNLSEFAVYKPAGEQRTAKIRVTPGGNRGDADQADSMRVESEHFDFIVRVETPVNCTSESFIRWLGREPMQNDEIVFCGQRYRVAPVLNGEPFKYTSGFRTAFRIHTTNAGTQ